jgi:dephospho-CoA kinase
MLKTLNSILHIEMKKKVVKSLSAIPNKLVVIDAALLFEIKLDELCDYVVTVEAPDGKIRERLEKSRNWGAERIDNILKVQERGAASRRQDIDYVFFNNDDEEKLRKQVEFFILAVL